LYSSTVFTAVNLFALKFYLDRVVPITIFSVRKLETLGYPKVKTISLCIPLFWQYQSVMDRRMDGQMDML